MSQHDEVELNPCWSAGCTKRIGHEGPCDGARPKPRSSDSGNAAYRSGFHEGIAEGELRILREVAKLPNPMWRRIKDLENHVAVDVCAWCGGEDEHLNGCLWPRALDAAKEGK